MACEFMPSALVESHSIWCRGNRPVQVKQRKLWCPLAADEAEVGGGVARAPLPAVGRPPSWLSDHETGEGLGLPAPGDSTTFRWKSPYTCLLVRWVFNV